MTITLPSWPADLPEPVLRRETRAMADGWVDVLGEVLTAGAIRGLYLKGSANKPWTSAIDYVPEHSDVDVHLALRSPDDERRFDDLEFAMDVAARVERAFSERVPRPLHRPKPQLTFVSALDALPGYLPSPPATVTTLCGEPYPELTLDAATRDAQRERDRENLRVHADYLATLPRRAIDRPGPLLERLTAELAWRVSPIAPRVLSLHGDAYEDVWTMNRTALVRRLEAHGADTLASAYTAFYLAGWRDVRARRSGDAAGSAAAARDGLLAGVHALRLGIAAAEASGR